MPSRLPPLLLLLLLSLLLQCTRLASSSSSSSPPLLGAKSLVQEMYLDLPSKICAILTDHQGEIGCRGRDSKNTAPLAPLLNERDLVAFVRAPRTSPRRVLLANSTLFTAHVLATLEATGRVEGLIVLPGAPPHGGRWSPASGDPNQLFSLHANRTVRWNPIGEAMTERLYSFPIAALTTGDFSRLLSMASFNAAQGNDHWPLHMAEMRSRMEARGNTDRCIADKTCDPLGGLSSWSSLVSMNASRAHLAANDFVLLSSPMDSNAMLHDLAHGATEFASLTALLATSEAFGRFKFARYRAAAKLPADGSGDNDSPALRKLFDADADQLAPLLGMRRNVLFAAFQGEAFGYIGSRAFAADTFNRSFHCVERMRGSDDQCYAPCRHDLSFEQVSLERMSAHVAVGQLLNVDVNASVFLHSLNDNSGDASTLLALLRRDAPRVLAPLFPTTPTTATTPKPTGSTSAGGASATTATAATAVTTTTTATAAPRRDNEDVGESTTRTVPSIYDTPRPLTISPGIGGEWGVPPSAVHSTAAKLGGASKLAGYVLADHHAAFENPLYHSRFDARHGRHIAAGVCAATKVLVRAAWSLATRAESPAVVRDSNDDTSSDNNGAPLPDDLTVDCRFVDSLLECLVADAGCSLVQEKLSTVWNAQLHAFGRVGFNAYTSVWQHSGRPKELESVVRAFLTTDTALVQHTHVVDPKTNATQNVTHWWNMAHFHEALSPGLAPASCYWASLWNVVDRREPMFAESRWNNNIGIRFFTASSPYADAVALVVGLVEFAVCFVGLWGAKLLYARKMKVV